MNVPFFDGSVLSDQGAILWFGQVGNTSNYADVRVGHNQDELSITLHIFDRLLWNDTTPAASDLDVWDAVTLYLHLSGNSGNTPDSNSYRFVAQATSWQARDSYQAAYQGDGSGWLVSSTPFTTRSGWRGGGFNDDQDDRGWLVGFKIPFASLGLTGPPPSGSIWGLALAVHDRDDAAGTPILAQTWPATMDAQRPTTWGQLGFDQPGYVPLPAETGDVVVVRHGLNGVTAVDAHVGGHSNCGAAFGPDFFSGWGDANYAGYGRVNIQNQWDIADWPCFSKYYVTLPLNTVPTGKTVISATLTMYLFGNPGYEPGQAQPSLIQVLTVADDWEESSITWNNAPLVVENVAATWVYPVDFYDPGVPYSWDVSRAVAEAYDAGEPLRLALYSADGDYHSGKYFWSSDADAFVRPTLQVEWGNPLFDLSVSPSVQSVESGGVATFAIQVQHGQGFTPTVTLEVGPSPSPDLMLDLAPPTAFIPPGGQTTLTLIDSHDPSFSSGLQYTVPVTATGGGVTQTASVQLFVNGMQGYLPLIIKN